MVTYLKCGLQVVVGVDGGEQLSHVRMHRLLRLVKDQVDVDLGILKVERVRLTVAHEVLQHI